MKKIALVALSVIFGEGAFAQQAPKTTVQTKTEKVVTPAKETTPVTKQEVKKVTTAKPAPVKPAAKTEVKKTEVKKVK